MGCEINAQGTEEEKKNAIHLEAQFNTESRKTGLIETTIGDGKRRTPEQHLSERCAENEPSGQMTMMSRI
ncbi:hypothetical protein RCL_jg3628.t1 [Rhizophagus clarus]|uniref:Uncharacterized protein n=1 Tax=Rhizophagus clarus TaxID=94130 RepID=A0A8H3M508_9GLOM|nr:hypothetical protein RCL_jg3628.t1 [Rhizophagus clarus]